MLALHGIWSRDSRLCVWGEDSELPAAAPKRRGRSPVRPRPRAHPFACPRARLWEALQPLGVALRPDGQAERELCVQLPSFAHGPQHSPQLLRPEQEAAAGRPDRMHPWTVPGIWFAPAGALDLLLALPSGEHAGVAFGDSLRFLGEAVKLALELVARGRLLPGLTWHEQQWLARWQPVVSDPDDADRVRLLSAAMPPLMRAEVGVSDHGRPPDAIVGDLLGAVLDACARRSLTGGLVKGQGRSPRSRSEVEAWLAALTAEDCTVAAEALGLAAVAEKLDEWRQAGERYAAHRTFRTCFRLSAPEDVPDCGDDGPVRWRVEILLQAKDEPSMLVAAEEVWSANGNGLRVLDRRIDDPQERLLGGLGHALRLWPELERALREPTPTGVDLDDEAAYRFLSDAVAPLQEAGFGVLAPAWWNERLRLSLKAEPLEGLEEGSGLFSLEGLCAYEWRVAVGEATLTLSELRELAGRKLPLVRARGRWIALRAEDVEQALAFFKGREERGALPVAELMRESLGLTAGTADLPPARIEAGGWLKELLESGERSLQETPTPPSFKGELRPYQERGLAWLSFLSGLGLGACLADDMGLGKTPQTLALLLAERERPANGSGRSGRRKRLGPTLLICPTSVLGNWQREAERFAPGLRVHAHHGRERLRTRKFAAAARRADLVITTYALAARDRETLAAVQWERVALDEAQNIKTGDAKQTKAIRSLPARHRIALTGTPIENRLSELHSIMDFLNPGLLGPAEAFKRRYATPIERWRDQAATERLRHATRPFILRRLKTDRQIITDLPEKIEMRVDCHLTKEQATLYQAVVDEMLEKAAHAQGIERSGIILAALMKLKQVCNHPAHLLKDRSQLQGRSGKLARVEELLAEALAEGDKALCFTQFAEFGQMLKPHLQERLGREVLFLHGGTPQATRDEMVQRFQAAAGPPLFVLSLKAGGTGLNLTAANHVIHFDRWWNPAVENQATDRAFRIGQRKNVQVRKLTCVGTVEERIDQLITRKKDLADRIVGSGETWVTELDTAQLRELVALSSDALEDAA